MLKWNNNTDTFLLTIGLSNVISDLGRLKKTHFLSKFAFSPFGEFNRLSISGSREKEEKEQQNLSLMLMFVVLVFMLCNVLAMVSNILEALKVRPTFTNFNQ